MSLTMKTIFLHNLQSPTCFSCVDLLLMTWIDRSHYECFLLSGAMLYLYPAVINSSFILSLNFTSSALDLLTIRLHGIKKRLHGILYFSSVALITTINSQQLSPSLHCKFHGDLCNLACLAFGRQYLLNERNTPSNINSHILQLPLSSPFLNF